MPTTDQPVITTAASTATATSSAVAADRAGRRDRRARGQIIVIFAAAIIVFMGLSAIVIDVSWFLSSQVRMQRAADAAALAGVVLLPGNVPGAVVPGQDRGPAQRFLRHQGLHGHPDPGPAEQPPDAGHDLRPDQYVLRARPRVRLVQLGRHVQGRIHPAGADGQPGELLRRVRVDPRVDRDVDGRRSPTPTAGTANSGNEHATTSPDATALPAGSWTAGSGRGRPRRSGSPRSAPTTRSTRTTTRRTSGPPPTAPPWCSAGSTCRRRSATGESVTSIRGLQVYLDDAWLIGHLRHEPDPGPGVRGRRDELDRRRSPPTRPADCRPGRTTRTDYTFGSANNFTAWTLSGGRTWNNSSDFSPTNFQVRLTARQGLRDGRDRAPPRPACGSSRPTTRPISRWSRRLTTNADRRHQPPGSRDDLRHAASAPATTPTGPILNPRGFWGTLNTQGAENVNGDAHQPYYDTRTGGDQPELQHDHDRPGVL